MEKHTKAVVLEATQAEAAALDPLDAQVEAFGGAVAGAGLVVGEDLGSPRRQGAPERADLLDVVLRTAGDGLVHQRGRLGRLIGEIQVPN